MTKGEILDRQFNLCLSRGGRYELTNMSDRIREMRELDIELIRIHMHHMDAVTKKRAERTIRYLIWAYRLNDDLERLRRGMH